MSTLKKSEYYFKLYTIWKMLKLHIFKNLNPLRLTIEKSRKTQTKILCGDCRHDESEREQEDKGRETKTDRQTDTEKDRKADKLQL